MAALTGVADTLAGRRIYLDANVFIYFLDGGSPWAARSIGLLTAARDGAYSAVTGEAVIAEVMVGPYRSRDPMLIRTARGLFDQPRLLEIVSHPASVWEDAAMLRGTLGMPLIDGLHLATAAASGCEAIVTNDQRMASALGVEVLTLADLG